VVIRSTVQTQPFTARPKWKAREAHDHTMRHQHLRQLFADDPWRRERFAVEAAGTYFEYSKNRIIDETIRLPVELAEGCGLRGRIAATFSGEKITVTEECAVLHAGVRTAADERCVVDDVNVVPGVGGGAKS
jgi:glucose-6-phosphate isomerase